MSKGEKKNWWPKEKWWPENASQKRQKIAPKDDEEGKAMAARSMSLILVA